MAQLPLRLLTKNAVHGMNNQTIFLTLNVVSQMAGFIEVPRLNFRRVFSYTRQAAASYSRPSRDSGERVLGVQIGDDAQPVPLYEGAGVTCTPFEFVSRRQARKAASSGKRAMILARMQAISSLARQLARQCL
jgi:hypothetical protein